MTKVCRFNCLRWLDLREGEKANGKGNGEK